MFNFYADKDHGIWGIYAIVNKINGWVYIGKHQDIYKRFEIHKYNLRSHNGKANKQLQADWDKYGEDAFEFKILKTIPKNKQNLSNLAWLELQTIYEDYAGQNLYNDENKRDEACFRLAKFYLSIDKEFKFREKHNKKVIDFYYEDENYKYVIDIHDPHDPRGYDQETIKSHQKLALDEGAEFQLINTNSFFGYQSPEPEIHCFNLTLDINSLKGGTQM